MGFFRAIDSGASALSAQRLRMDTISQNIANANTTRTENGTPYRRKVVLFEERNSQAPFSKYLKDAAGGQDSAGDGVRVSKIVEDTSAFKKVYEPGNPDADADGYMELPNVDVVTEMVNMISATRAYEANVTAVNATKGMAMKALEIGR